MRKKMPLLDKHVEQELEELFFSRWIEKASVVLEEKCDSIVEEKMRQFFERKISVKEAARITGRSEHAIRKMCERGKLPFTKEGNAVLIRFDDIRSVLLHVEDEIGALSI